MMKCKKTIGSLLFCFACSITPNLAFAGAVDLETPGGNRMKFEYAGDNLRINTGQAGSYMIINTEGMYMVNNAGGQLMVIDAGKMIGMFGDMAPATPTVASSKVVSLVATGRREKLAGIDGEIYTLEYVDKASGDVQTTELVLSDDPRAIEMTRAMSGMAASMVKAMGQPLEGADDFQKHMATLDKGVLRYGKDMWVAAISNRTIARDRFVLPAAPTDLSVMSGIADALKSNSAQSATTNASGQAGEETQKKGLVSGFLSVFGKKAGEQTERQQGRAETQTDDAVEKATDKAVDNVLDKAFGKLFGK